MKIIDRKREIELTDWLGDNKSGEIAVDFGGHRRLVSSLLGKQSPAFVCENGYNYRTRMSGAWRIRLVRDWEWHNAIDRWERGLNVRRKSVEFSFAVFKRLWRLGFYEPKSNRETKSPTSLWTMQLLLDAFLFYFSFCLGFRFFFFFLENVWEFEVTI